MSRSLLMIAVLPTFVIFAIVLKNARAAREPFKKIAKVFGISVASTIVAMILELLGTALESTIFEALGKDPKSVLGVLVDCLLVVALVEEGCKYFSFKLMIFHDREFDNTYDGVIYGAASALGFATLENILYVFDGGLGTGLLRAVLSVPLHACTGIFMGYYFGISKYKKYNDIEHDKNPQRRAYLIAVVIHALYDFFLMAEKATDAPEKFIYITILGVLVIMVIVYVMMVLIIKKAKREDQPIYNRFYYEHLNGAYQDMRGQTSEKMEGNFQVPVMAHAGQPYNQPMNTQYGQPMQRPMNTGAPNMYGGQPPMYGRQPAPPYNNMNNPYPPNRNYQQNNFGAANRPPQNGFGMPNQRNTPYGMPPQQGPQRTGFRPVNDPAPAPQPKISFCNECGNKLDPGTTVCPVCGTKV